MRISVFGTGYVGLVTGTCFAEMGNEVICVDVDQQKIELLKKGVSPIYEMGLEGLIHSNSKEGRLNFTTDIRFAVTNSEIHFIAVGTPSDTNGSADLQYVLQVADSIGEHLVDRALIVTKSTVPVGTATKVRKTIQARLKQRNVDVEFDVVSNPEFLREGTAIEDCLKPSRVVVGCESEWAKDTMKRIYGPFVKNGNPIIIMDILSSELTKYAANAMLATKISFMNELSRLCDKVGADVEKVRNGIGSDPRIGFQFIYPGLGYGGSCFPKDVKALIRTGNELGEDLGILKSVEKANQLQRQRFCEAVEKHFHEDLSEKTIGIWGVAFKPGTDDIREAPAIDLMERFHRVGATLLVFDPVAAEAAKKKCSGLDRVHFCESPYDALQGVDALCIMTEWKQFREPNFAKMKQVMKSPAIFDGRNLYDCEEMKNEGFYYHSVGRKLIQ